MFNFKQKSEHINRKYYYDINNIDDPLDQNNDIKFKQLFRCLY